MACCSTEDAAKNCDIRYQLSSWRERQRAPASPTRLDARQAAAVKKKTASRCHASPRISSPHCSRR